MRRITCVIAVLLLAVPARAEFLITHEPVHPSGVRATADLPPSQHHKNVGGRDGAGLCVFTSIWHCTIWQDVFELDGFRDWMKSKPGGGWPQKVDDMLARYCREKGIKVPPYAQHTGGDARFLELAMKTGRMVGVTYCGRDPHYGPAVIAHMVNLIYLDDSLACILDNNFPGDFLWMSRKEFESRWRGNSGGWAFVLLAPPPPPYSAAMMEQLSHAGCYCGADCKCKPGVCPNKCPVIVGQCPGGRCGIPSGPIFVPACPGGGCSGGSCPLPIPAPQLPQPILPQPLDAFGAGGAWVEADTGGEWGFWRGGKCIARAFADGRCEAVDGRGFATGEAIEPPAPLPAGAAAKGAENRDLWNGVDASKLAREHVTKINGRVVEMDEFAAAVSGLSDDSARWHLTAVGDKAFLSGVRADVERLSAVVRGKLHVQYYTPDRWEVAQFGLQPGVDLRAPSTDRKAKVLSRCDASAYTSAKLPELLGCPGGPDEQPAKPKPSPLNPFNPDPKKPDSDPAKPQPAPNSSPDKPATPADHNWCLALLATLVFLLREFLKGK